MRNRRICHLLIKTGIFLILLQMIFGLWTMLFTRFQPMTSEINSVGDSMTSEGAKLSLIHFGNAALLAGFAAGLIIMIAGSLMRKGAASIPSGILLITAGAANSVILFSVGLPAGTLLMAAGVLMLSNIVRTEKGNHKST
jgi:hypothetical protein